MFPDTIQVDPVRGACRFVRSDVEAYNAEELNAMLFSYIKDLVQEHTGKPVRRCVITVPAFFAESDRRALLAAAKIAGLDVLSLVNDGLAVALKYATDNVRLATFKGVQRVLFFDMGATATQATLVEFRGRESTAPSSAPSSPSVRVLGTAWDSSLGGAAFTNRLVDLLVRGCAPKVDLSKDYRAMSRLRKEASRSKHVLSANKETVVSVEDILGDYDLKQQVTRTEFEQHCSDLLDRVHAPIFTALSRAGNLTLKELDAIEMVGGGWRVPSVQQVLKGSVAGMPLGKTLNADEAACSGAATLALYLARTASSPKTKRAASVFIQDLVPHDLFVTINSEVVAVIPGGSPLVVLGGARPDAEPWDEEEDVGLQVTIPVATSKDFFVNLQYTRDASARPFGTYLITGVSAADEASGRGGSAAGAGGYSGGGSQTVELHVRSFFVCVCTLFEVLCQQWSVSALRLWMARWSQVCACAHARALAHTLIVCQWWAIVTCPLVWKWRSSIHTHDTISPTPMKHLRKSSPLTLCKCVVWRVESRQTPLP